MEADTWGVERGVLSTYNTLSLIYSQAPSGAESEAAIYKCKFVGKAWRRRGNRESWTGFNFLAEDQRNRYPAMTINVTSAPLAASLIVSSTESFVNQLSSAPFRDVTL